MILESVLHQRELDAPPKTGATRAIGPGVAKDLFLVVIACLTFIIAKSMTSRAEINISELEYWIVGALPLLMLNFYGRATQRSATIKQANDVTRLYCVAWIVALVFFIITRETHYYEWLRDIALDDLHIGRTAAELLMSFGAVLFGLAVAIILSVWLGRSIHRRALPLAGLLLINTSMFELLIYWIR